MLKILEMPIEAGITGFDSPAANYLELPLSLDEILIEKKHASLLGIASGDSMEGAGIFDGDLLIADRSCQVRNLDIVIAVLNGEFTAKYWLASSKQLASASDLYSNVKVTDSDSFTIEAVVTRSVRLFRPSPMLHSCLRS